MEPGAAIVGCGHLLKGLIADGKQSVASEHGCQHIAWVLLAVVQPILVLLDGLISFLLAIPIADLIAQAGADAEPLCTFGNLEQGARNLRKGGVVVKDRGHALLDAVNVQRIGAGPGARQGQMAVNIPPLAVQDLIEIRGVEAVDAQPSGQGGVNVGVGVDEAGHDDAAPGVDPLRLGIVRFQLGGGPDGSDFAAIDDNAAIGQIGQGAVTGDKPSICQ